ncbi:rhomboid family protein membrane protein [Coccidioides immitis RMSCC 2394]|uniref:Rhomboid-type serine protease n=1 Tax=Coccidioides immitis RMSCC 2394 TaxID=404692 RepID=A0A0J6YQ83_COCIT|nr:rhomboid family protein membrane protein [Coccidioides immitis RMSCC 2394]
MAANEYYNTGYASQQPSWNHGQSPSSAQPYANTYGPQQSQYDMNSDHDLSGGGGKYNSNDYADDIPLKPNAASQPGRPEWSDVETHYSPAQYANASPVPDAPIGDPKRRRRTRFKKIPWVVYITSIIQVAVFIAEIAKYAQLTGSPIMIRPQFNPMIGPSPYVQINMGARFVACMRNVKGVQDAKEQINWPCPQSTSSDPESPDNKCTLSELCGLGGVPNPRPGGSINDKDEPNQWFRFIIPIFLHAGLIHIGVNLLAQLVIGADMERSIGWWRFAIIYYASGIFGFVFGGNFAAPGIASTGASGSLFGILALCVLDLLYKWNSIRRPMTYLLMMILAVAISFVLGLLPGLDNFSHIGGFLMGLALGICLMRSPDTLRERIGATTPYMSVDGSPAESAKKFIKEPVGFFKGRKPLWWAWWLLRAGALVGILIAFILLLNNFYKYRSECSWCKYLSCLPIKNWCDVGNIGTTTTSPNNRRGLLVSA